MTTLFEFTFLFTLGSSERGKIACSQDWITFPLPDIMTFQTPFP